MICVFCVLYDVGIFVFCLFFYFHVFSTLNQIDKTVFPLDYAAAAGLTIKYEITHNNRIMW